jgi:hypothetical protein
MKRITQICLCNFVLIALILSVIGCNQNVPLGGRITFTDNGEPLSEGTIVFVSGTNQARSEISKDGQYRLGFKAEGDGLPKGEYKVYIQALHIEIQRGKEDNDGDGEPDIIERTETQLIATKYAYPETSGLIFAADGKTKTFNITVERPSAK